MNGRGVPELAAYLRAVPARPPDPMHFVRKAVADAYGRFGLSVLSDDDWAPGAAATTPYEELEAAARAAVRRRLR